MNRPNLQPALHILCAGAAQGLVKALQPRFQADTGSDIQGRFGAVGAMQEALRAGEACDVLVVTQSMIETLFADGNLAAGSSAALGRVRTGVAVRSGEPLPDVHTPDALRAALLAATAIYFPDAVRSTAGIHFAKVMQQLGVHETVQARCRTFPNGATAMRELAGAAPGAIGCTQVTEINYTDGVDLVGPLPSRFELATVYAAAVNAKSTQPALAARLVALLTGVDAAGLRTAGGFEV